MQVITRMDSSLTVNVDRKPWKWWYDLLGVEPRTNTVVRRHCYLALAEGELAPRNNQMLLDEENNVWNVVIVSRIEEGEVKIAEVLLRLNHEPLPNRNVKSNFFKPLL